MRPWWSNLSSEFSYKKGINTADMIMPVVITITPSAQYLLIIFFIFEILKSIVHFKLKVLALKVREFIVGTRPGCERFY